MHRDNTPRPINAQVRAAMTALLFLACPAVQRGVQAQSIRGVVVEAATKKAVPAAGVELLDERGRLLLRSGSDSLGLFTLNPTRAGTYLLRTTHPGFFPHPADTVRLGDAESISIEIRLDRAVIPLEPIVVRARAKGWLEGFERRRRAGGFGRFITREDVLKRSASQTSDLLRGTPGLVVTPQRRGPPLLQMRGTSGLCQPAIWIDGLYVAQYQGGTTLDDVISPQALDGVEIYSSVTAAPIEYRTGTCGVLLFWTHRGSADEGGRFQWKKVLGGAGAAILFIILVTS
jgi:hypothetical protein